MPTNNLISGPVLEVFINNRDIEVTLNQLRQETGFEDNRIRAAITHMRAKGIKLDQVLKGQCWIYRTPPGAKVVKAPENLPRPIVEVEKAFLESVKEEEPVSPPVPAPPRKPVYAVPTPQPRPPVGDGGGGRFIMPAPHKENEFFRVVSRNAERVLLEDAQGKVWRATEI